MDHSNPTQIDRLVGIGAKEGMAREIMDRTGTNIANPVLHHADGVRFKKVDKYQLRQLIDAIMEDAERPDPVKIRKQVTEVMAFSFDWREISETNQECSQRTLQKKQHLAMTSGTISRPPSSWPT